MHNGILAWRVKEQSMFTKVIRHVKKLTLERRIDYCFRCAEVERKHARQAWRNAAWFEKEALRAKTRAAEL